MAPKTTPKSALERVVHAIRSQPATANGVSRIAIAKYLKQEFDWVDNKKLNLVLKKAIKDGKLTQAGQSFRVSGDPIVELPPEPTVEIVDSKVGEGNGAKDGDTVVVKYHGKLSDGTVFDESDSFDFVLGTGDVIKGWDQGIKGMKVGGVRMLTVPSILGYGKRGSSPDIPPNADLFFEVTLKKIN